MEKDYTHIDLIIDKSGSMREVRDQTIDGCNKFLKDQKAAPGRATLSMILFDTQFQDLYLNVDIQKVDDLTHDTYKPEGYTAMLDAIARGVITTGHHLESLPEAKRPSKIIVAIQTDGMENSSKEYAVALGGTEKIRQMIRHQTDKYGWQFVFLGANIDAVAVADDIGVTPSNALNYAANAIGTEKAFSALNKNTRQYRAGVKMSMSFEDGDRVEQAEVGAHVDPLAKAAIDKSKKK